MLLDKSVDYIPVLMVHEDPKNYPHVEPAEGYTIRGYLPGDEEHWARIECAVGQFDDYGKARACFVREFLSQPERAATNCLFAIAPNGMPVGMLSLWYGGILGDDCMRLHWLAVDPDHQGKRLSQALMTAAMDLYVSQGHTGKLYLWTSTHSNQAVRLYKRFGFVPYRGEKPKGWGVENYPADNERAWEIIDAKNKAYDELKARKFDLTLARSFGYASVTEEKMADAVAAGITHIEIAPGTMSVDFGKSDADQAELKAKKEMLDRLGIRVLSVHLPFGWDWDASTTNEAHHVFLLERQLNYAKLFAIFNPERYILHPCYWPIPETESAVRIAHIRQNAATIAFQTGKQVCIEDLKIGRIGGSSDELLVLGEGLSNVGFCVDVNHFMRERPEDAIRKLGNRVWSLHISDYDFVDERHWLPGEGSNDWTAILQALEDVGYKGPFLYEVKAYYTNAQVAENKKALFDAYNKR